MLKSELGHAPVGVLGIRISEIKHVIGITKLSCLVREHAPVGVLGREAVEVLKGRPLLSQLVGCCSRKPAQASPGC